jgi:hypothetical protein
MAGPSASVGPSIRGRYDFSIAVVHFLRWVVDAVGWLARRARVAPVLDFATGFYRRRLNAVRR